MLTLSLPGCAVAVDSADTSCAAHDYAQFVHGEFGCVGATAPTCNFDGELAHSVAKDAAITCLCGANGTYGCGVVSGYTACTTVTDSVANDDCAPGQTSVTRCSSYASAPSADCTGPVGHEGQSLGKVWCCSSNSTQVSQ
jgi:hypothetical protein